MNTLLNLVESWTFNFFANIDLLTNFLHNHGSPLSVGEKRFLYGHLDVMLQCAEAWLASPVFGCMLQENNTPPHSKTKGRLN